MSDAGSSQAVKEAAYNRAVATRLREVRQASGLSQRDVEKASDGEFTATCVIAWENCYRHPRLPRLAAYAAFLGVPLCDLLPDRGGAEQVHLAELSDGLDLIATTAAHLADLVRAPGPGHRQTLTPERRNEVEGLLRQLREVGRTVRIVRRTEEVAATGGFDA